MRLPPVRTRSLRSSSDRCLMPWSSSEDETREGGAFNILRVIIRFLKTVNSKRSKIWKACSKVSPRKPIEELIEIKDDVINVKAHIIGDWAWATYDETFTATSKGTSSTRISANARVSFENKRSMAVRPRTLLRGPGRHSRLQLPS